MTDGNIRLTVWTQIETLDLDVKRMCMLSLKMCTRTGVKLRENSSYSCAPGSECRVFLLVRTREDARGWN